MKKRKIILLVTLIFLAVVLSGCTKTTDSNGIKREVRYGLVEVKTITDYLGGKTFVCYDPNTMVCYMIAYEGHQMGMSPYYVISGNGEPEIAVYGVNFGYKVEGGVD